MSIFLKNKISPYNPDFDFVFKKLLGVAKSLGKLSTEPSSDSDQGFYLNNNLHILVSICNPIDDDGNYSLEVCLSVKRPSIEELELLLIITFTGSKLHDCISYEILSPTGNLEFDNLAELISITAIIQTFASHVICHMSE